MNRPNQPKRAAARVAHNIVADIRERELPPGTQLEPEHKMIEHHGVARGTVREALRYLEWQGALRIKTGPGGGPVVAVPGVEDLVSALSLQLQFADASFRSISHARASIYPVLARKAAESATYQEVMALHACLERLKEGVGDLAQFKQAAQHFHELIAVSAKDLVLGLLVNTLHRISDELPIEYDIRHQEDYFKQMRRTLRAIEQKDGDQAQQVTEQMMAAAIAYLEEFSPDLMSAPVSWIAPNR